MKIRPVVMLVSGSRALDPRYHDRPGTPGSEGWSRRTLASVIETLPPRSIVLAGRCPFGPDLWAAESAHDYKVRLVEFDADGARFVDGHPAGRWEPRWCRHFQTIAYKVRPLARNQAMVEAAAAGRADGYDVRVVGLVAPWAHPGGTDSTISRARIAGLEVRRLVCPKRLRPTIHALPPLGVIPTLRGIDWVYFIQAADGTIKIGHSIDPTKRLADLQVAHAYPLRLLAVEPGGADHEASLHGAFHYLRLNGEWFSPDDDLFEHIAACRPYDPEAVSLFA